MLYMFLKYIFITKCQWDQYHFYLCLPNLKSTHLQLLPKFLCFDFSEKNYFLLPFNRNQFVMRKCSGGSQSSLYRALHLYSIDSWVDMFRFYARVWLYFLKETD